MAICFKIPDIAAFCKDVHDNNVMVNRLFHDAYLQIKISLYGSLIINTGYAIFQLGLGFYYSSLWFCTISAYYVALAVMRFFLLKDVRSITVPGEDRKSELLRFRFCGIGLMTITVVLAVIIFYITKKGEGFQYINKFITLAMAAYTFGALVVAIVNVIRYRKYKSPVCSAAKAISLSVASISVLTLESGILRAFGTDYLLIPETTLIGFTGFAVWVFVFCVATYMIIRANIELSKLRKSTSKQ